MQIIVWTTPKLCVCSFRILISLDTKDGYDQKDRKTCILSVYSPSVCDKWKVLTEHNVHMNCNANSLPIKPGDFSAKWQLWDPMKQLLDICSVDRSYCGLKRISRHAARNIYIGRYHKVQVLSRTIVSSKSPNQNISICTIVLSLNMLKYIEIRK